MGINLSKETIGTILDSLESKIEMLEKQKSKLIKSQITAERNYDYPKYKKATDSLRTITLEISEVYCVKDIMKEAFCS